MLSPPGLYLASFTSQAGTAQLHRTVGAGGAGTHALISVPFSFHLLAAEQEAWLSGLGEGGMERMGSEEPSLTLRHPARPESLGSLTVGLLGFSQPCLFLPGSITETWSIWRRPAFNCPLSTHCDSARHSSHTIRQMSD